MCAHLKSWAGVLAIALATLLAVGGARAADVSGVRVWADASHTRLVFDLQGAPDYRIDRGNDQVVIDLAHGKLAGGFTDPSAQGRFRGMRQAQQGERLQLTAQMTPGSQVRSFVLKPASGEHYRLVVDLFPAGGDAVDAHVADAKPATGAQLPAASISLPPPAPVMMDAHVPARDADRIGAKRQIIKQAAALLDGQRKVVVCVDAGHGGKDSGAIGPGGLMEKNVTLAVARDLAAEINKQPGMEAILTRNSDVYVPLERRYQIAREHDADLFISIHADSYTSDDARGSSVWVLSSRGKSSVAARMLADRENSSDLIGGVTLDNKSNNLAKVLLDMQQGWAVHASDVVASNVLKALGQIGPTHRGYVEHANFVVLRSPDVPSILVETAFISNPSEERKLANPVHQQALASAVMSGVKGYFESTPPPGTWFAAQAARRDGIKLAPITVARADRARTDAARLNRASDRKSAPLADADVQDLHRVGNGESLRSIARRYGVSVGSLKSANRLTSNSVRAGMVLAIPAS